MGRFTVRAGFWILACLLAVPATALAEVSGLHLNLTSVVGPTGALRPAVLGAGAADRDLLLGGRATGLAVEGSRLDAGARVG